MAMTVGARGEDGHNLVRDIKTFKKNFEVIDFSSRAKKQPAKVTNSRKRYKYN